MVSIGAGKPHRAQHVREGQRQERPFQPRDRADLDREGHCWTVRFLPHYGATAELLLEEDTGALIFAWYVPEG